MRKFFVVSALSSLLLGMSSPLMAADYGAGIVSKSPTQGYTDVEFGSGWYLRGDISYSIGSDVDVSFSRDYAAGDANASAEDHYGVGLGFGYIFNEHLRADATFDYFSDRDWHGSASGCGDNLGVPYTGDCASSDSGTFEAHGMSVNAYANLGNLGGFSPYVGGGIGLAHVEYSGTNSDITCTVDPGESCHLGAHSGATANPETFTDNQTFAGGTSVNLTYALMLGLDYKIDENWTVDMNYRYTHISSDEVYSSGADSVHFDGADIHEVRAGVRYEVW